MVNTKTNNELTYVEEPFLAHLEMVGWTVERWKGGKGCRVDFGDVILENYAKAAILDLNPWLTDSQADDLVTELHRFEKISLVERNRECDERLAVGLSAYNEETGEDNQPVRLIDFAKPKNNSFLAVSQFRIQRLEKEVMGESDDDTEGEEADEVKEVKVSDVEKYLKTLGTEEAKASLKKIKDLKSEKSKANKALKKAQTELQEKIDAIRKELTAEQCETLVMDGEESLTTMKCGTVFTLAVFKKVLNGKHPKEFDKNDWAEIAKAVSGFAVCYDNQQYSQFVFLLYAEYIEFSVSIMEGRVADDTVRAIRSLATTLREETEMLNKGDISEVTYVDRCLWLSLEAIIKLLASMICLAGGDTAEQLTQAVASLAFEYGRYVLFLKEQSLLTEYLEHQYKLDAELQNKYDAFVVALNAEAESFINLVNHAFEPDFESLLMNSAKLASAAGVGEKEILDSIEKVDSFFMD